VFDRPFNEGATLHATACLWVAAGAIIVVGFSRGDIAQLGERGVRNAEVGGSSPPISTTLQPVVPLPLSLHSDRALNSITLAYAVWHGSLIGLDRYRCSTLCNEPVDCDVRREFANHSPQAQLYPNPR
jgi:hypothetical protein